MQFCKRLDRSRDNHCSVHVSKMERNTVNKDPDRSLTYSKEYHDVRAEKILALPFEGSVCMKGGTGKDSKHHKTSSQRVQVLERIQTTSAPMAPD